jgi:hypothetical protein
MLLPIIWLCWVLGWLNLQHVAAAQQRCSGSHVMPGWWSCVVLLMRLWMLHSTSCTVHLAQQLRETSSGSCRHRAPACSAVQKRST